MRETRYRYKSIVESVVHRLPVSAYATDDKRIVDILNADIESRLWHMVSCIVSAARLPRGANETAADLLPNPISSVTR